MIETVRDSDYVLLVTEPTPFGLHDLRLASEVVKSMKVDCGVVINRASFDMQETRQFCQQVRIPILAEIPDILAIAEAYSEGKLAVETVPGMRRTFAKLLLQLPAAAQSETLPEAVRQNLNLIVNPPAVSASDHPPMAKDGPAPVCYLALRARGAGPARA